MKFIHTSDLHIGKTVNEFSMIKDQEHALKQIHAIAVEERANVLVIAGDVYDRSIPSTEAVELLDDFLTEVLADGIQIIMISGNHDSAERVTFADRILEKQGLHIAGGYEGTLKCVDYEDELGKVTFVCLPFVKPAAAGGKNSAEAVEEMLKGREQVPGSSGERVPGSSRERMPESSSERTMGSSDEQIPGDSSGHSLENSSEQTQESSVEQISGSSGQAENGKMRNRQVLVTHFFVTGTAGETPELSDAETTIHVGGLDTVPVSLFAEYDYTALGHIHKPQQIGGEQVQYSGAPLKYSFSEVKHVKSVNVVSWDADGELRIRKRMIRPLHEMRILRGCLEELMKPGAAPKADREDYIQAVLTDEIELIDPIGTLRSVYPNVMQIILDKNYRETGTEYESKLTVQRKSITELFGGFYEMLKGEKLDEKREEIVSRMAEKMEE